MALPFSQYIFNKHHSGKSVPDNSEITNWVNRMIALLFPEQKNTNFRCVQHVENEFTALQSDLQRMIKIVGNAQEDEALIACIFFENLPVLYNLMKSDVKAIFDGDPAANSEFEVIRAYPGFFAISLYRVAHALNTLGVNLLPRIITEYAHSKTGIDIHPAATIGPYFHIDHGTGIVIGESCQIGQHVKLYQGVTLGALSVNKSMAHTKRHPTLEDHIIVYSGATILGGQTLIGHHSVIGGNIWLTTSVPPFSVLHHRSHYKTGNKKEVSAV
ncbi:serine acetyltransferase [Mucilaginibacter sabulilitoris]|uniref:Serine acetyltransferase n=1 Tax=Mucilaginibacter sabulilitoris TaxID=1173583 RepID=A0ABZ0TUC0_9SPHI|nr:serine acetyltransferase [Mucilaginibacter sabulilitoris]WPU95673.1 serine acetyltransferase [Mucilaginibacter sabulilitoris]